jgi:hypothetical protein
VKRPGAKAPLVCVMFAGLKPCAPTQTADDDICGEDALGDGLTEFVDGEGEPSEWLARRPSNANRLSLWTHFCTDGT